MRKIDINDFPEGALTRYIRDIYGLSKSDISFDDFKKQWKIDYDNNCRERNKNHSVEFDKVIHLNSFESVHFFKRKGEEWICSQCNMAPNGGCGNILLEEALKICNIKDVSQI